MPFFEDLKAEFIALARLRKSAGPYKERAKTEPNPTKWSFADLVAVLKGGPVSLANLALGTMRCARLRQDEPQKRLGPDVCDYLTQVVPDGVIGQVADRVAELFDLCAKGQHEHAARLVSQWTAEIGGDTDSASDGDTVGAQSQPAS